MKIADGVEMLELSSELALGPGIIHPALIWDTDTVILVDTGLPGLLPQIREAMEKAGVPFHRLNKIIMTHHDMDHLGSLSTILNESPNKIEVLAHEAEKPYIQADRPPIRLTQIEAQLNSNSLPEDKHRQMKTLYEGLKANYKKYGAAVDKTVADGEELPYCGGITVIYTPGHMPGHICLYLKSSKTLVTGDALNVENGQLVPAPKFTNVDNEAAARSLKKLTGYDIDTVICYHGGLYKDDANRRIAQIAGEV